MNKSKNYTSQCHIYFFSCNCWMGGSGFFLPATATSSSGSRSFSSCSFNLSLAANGQTFYRVSRWPQAAKAAFAHLV